MSVLHIPFKFSIIPKDAIGNMIEITFGSLSKKPFKFSMLSRVFFLVKIFLRTVGKVIRTQVLSNGRIGKYHCPTRPLTYDFNRW